MAYKINGTTITLQPTEGNWVNRERVAVDGNQHPIYPALREFELKWDLVSASEFNQLLGFFNAVGTTGTAVVTLPKYGNASWLFYDYSGCVLSEPELGAYFETYGQSVKLLVSRIRA